jgi:Host cell surface-exposed lipoprotein
MKQLKFLVPFLAVVALVLGVGGVASASPQPNLEKASASQENALRAAEGYLEISAFSKSGLEKQLKFEGYSSSAARYGATHAGANWYHQAAKAARAYLQVSSFSKPGLQQQLEFEGFTSAQAQFGVSRAYH